MTTDKQRKNPILSKTNKQNNQNKTNKFSLQSQKKCENENRSPAVTNTLSTTNFV